MEYFKSNVITRQVASSTIDVFVQYALRCMIPCAVCIYIVCLAFLLHSIQQLTLFNQQPPELFVMVVTAHTPPVPPRISSDRTGLHATKNAQDNLEAMGAGLTAKMQELHGLQDAFESAVKKQKKMLRNLKSGRSLSSTASSSTNRGQSNSELKLESARLEKRLKELELLMPAKGGMFVELFLGSINVRFAKKKERLAFKTEYEKLKLKLAPVFVVFCILCLILEDYRWIHMFLQLALSCYYVTLAVRENILRANGSNIRPWWIIHHYFTMMQGVLLLTWPNGESYARFRRQLHLFGLYNAMLMIFQTRYQMARLYTLRSLGKANEMDVASSDSTQIHWSETMRLLLPLVIFGQLFQASQSITLFRLYRSFPTELQILLLSLLSLANFIGNSTTTMQVLRAKQAANKEQGQQEVNSGKTNQSNDLSDAEGSLNTQIRNLENKKDS